MLEDQASDRKELEGYLEELCLHLGDEEDFDFVEVRGLVEEIGVVVQRMKDREWDIGTASGRVDGLVRTLDREFGDQGSG